MDILSKAQKEKLIQMVEAAIHIEGAAAEHFDKYNKKGRELYEARGKIQKELFDFIKEL